MGIFTGSPVLGTGAGESTGGGTGGGLSSVKTDGVTVLGDGVNTPLAASMEYLGIGDYLFACVQNGWVKNATDKDKGIRMRSMGGSEWDSYAKTILPGSAMIPDYIAEYHPDYLGINQFSPTIPGTWRCQGLVSTDENAWTVFKRIA
ncbi:TPA: hypothetical protein ACIBOF_004426 [Salmonella enterica subsp. diarizonae serovar 61:r:-]